MNTKILLSGFAILAALGLVVATTSAFAQNMTGGNMTGDNATTATSGDEEEDNGDDEENEDDEGEGSGN
ncbi:hypothetical protein BH18THE2_BH18THE2_13140 [soil metagenome]